MATIRVTNTTALPVSIDDVGVVIPALSFDDFTDNGLLRDLAVSDDLRTLIGLGTLTISDGVNALVVDDLAAYYASGGVTEPKGSLPVSTGPGFKNLPAGADGEVPVADSNIATGLRYYALPFRLGNAILRWWQIQQNGGLTTLNQSGFTTAPTLEGVATVLNTAIAQFIRYTSAAVTGSDAGWISTVFTQTRMNYRPWWHCAMQVGPTITNLRKWLGLFASDPMASSDPAIEGMGFRYATDVDGTAFWRCWSNDGVAGGLVTVTTVPLTANTEYRLSIEVVRGTLIRFYINEILVASHAAMLPAGATNLGHVEETRTLDAVSKTMNISKVACEQRAA